LSFRKSIFLQKGFYQMEQTNSKAEALLEQGMDYIENDAVDRGLPYLKQAAELGLLEAQAMYLGTLLLSEDSDKDYTKEIKKCVEWIRAAAINGNPEGQEMLGEIYSGGLGVPENQETAVKWYRKAAMQGNDGAQYYLGECYYWGKGVAQNDAEAVKWFQKAANQEHAGAQYYLGECYYLGRGVAENDAKAVKWFQKAAEQGNADAQFQLGHCYLNGNGVLKDERKAAALYQEAANQGHAKAQYWLGDCYQLGQGIEKDFRKSIEWYKKSMDNGYCELDIYDSISSVLLFIIWGMEKNGASFQKIARSKELAEGIQYAEYAINHFDCENAEDGNIYDTLAELYRYKNLDRALDYAEHAVALGVEGADKTLQDLRSINGTFGNIGRFLSGLFD
jgi:TPR repeat protein